MTMKPCIWCPKRGNCKPRELMRKPALELGLTTMGFRCREYYSMFPAGSVVRAKLPYVWDGTCDYADGWNFVEHGKPFGETGRGWDCAKCVV